MIDSLNSSARKRLLTLVAESPDLQEIMSDRQSVYDDVQRAVGAYKRNVKKSMTTSPTGSGVHLRGDRHARTSIVGASS